MFDPGTTSIILVPGQWHTELHVQPCLPTFRAIGYNVIPCPLLCVGTDKERNTFADEVANIHSKMVEEATKGKRFCVIAHSAGGIPTAEAVNKFLATNPDMKDLVHLVFVAVFVDFERARKINESWFVVDFNAMTSTTLDSNEHFYSDISTEESRPFVEALRVAFLWLDDVGTTSDDWKSVRKSYIRCQQDQAIPAEVQDKEMEENGFGENQRAEMDVGHCPFISQPENFVATIDKVLRS